MAIAEYIGKKFLRKELCFSLSDTDTETILYDGIWTQNREFFKGVVVEADSGVVVLDIQDIGLIYINEESISFFYEPDLNIHNAISTMFTKKLSRAKEFPNKKQ
jgi:hypothetical protein